MSPRQIESYKLDLLDKYPGGYYAVSNYGYGDGACYGPFDAFTTLETYCEIATQGNPIENITKGLPYNKNYINSLINQFESARKQHGMNPIHYITENDESDRFDDFMSS